MLEDIDWRRDGLYAVGIPHQDDVVLVEGPKYCLHLVIYTSERDSLCKVRDGEFLKRHAGDPESEETVGKRAIAEDPEHGTVGDDGQM
jgi:hypothetical protein